MARDLSRNPSTGATLHWIAVFSAAVYTVFAIVAASGGSEATYQVALWASWVLILIMAAAVFGIGSVMARRSVAQNITASEPAPVLTSVI